MSDAAAPAPAPTNGAAPRNNAGQFSPKAGATGVVAQEGATATQGADGAPPSGPQTVEEWNGYEGEVDVYGEKIPIKVKSKAEALRAHQELLAYRKRIYDISQAEKRLREREAAGPDESTVNERARKRVIEAARLIDMTPEQRELHQLKQEIQRRDEQTAADQRRQAEEATQQQRRVQRERAVAGLEKGLELTGLPRTHHTMALLAEIQQEATSQGMPELPPDLLAAEANKRYGERGVEPLKKLQGKALLDRLTPEVVRAVLLAERERRGLAAGQPRQASQAVPRDERMPDPSSEKVYGEAEAEQKLREMRNRR